MSDLSTLKIKMSDLGKWPVISLAAGLIGLIVTLAIILLASTAESKGIYLRSYLVGFIFWFNMAAGCIFWLMVNHLSGGAWGVMIRRVCEAGSKMMVWSLIFLIPMILGMKYVYPWAMPNALDDHIIAQKAALLNLNSYYIRLVVYAVIWGFLAFRISALSSKQDKGIDPKLTISMKRLSAVGLLLLFMTMTFASIDWLLSLEPEFSSSMYGPCVLTGQALGSMAMIVAVMVLLIAKTSMKDRLNSGHVHDLGNFLLAATLFWAYVNFAQFLIIWGANTAEQAPYYLRRMTGGWGFLGAGLIAFHFFAPFMLLLNRKLKKNIHVLVKLAYFIIFMRFLDLCYLVIPSAQYKSHYLGQFDLVAMIVAAIAVIGIGGLWLVMFFRILAQRPLIPINDPYTQEALDFRGGH